MIRWCKCVFYKMESRSKEDTVDQGASIGSAVVCIQQAGVWIRMGNAPNITAAQQKVVEAPLQLLFATLGP